MKNVITPLLLLFVMPASAMVRALRPLSAQLRRIPVMHQIPRIYPQVPRWKTVPRPFFTAPMHNQLRSKKPWLAAASMVGLSTFIAANALHDEKPSDAPATTPSPQKPWAAVEEKYLRMLQEEEWALLEEYYRLTGKPYDDYLNKLMDQTTELHKKLIEAFIQIEAFSMFTICPWRNLINSILDKHGFGPKNGFHKVSILQHNESGFFTMAGSHLINPGQIIFLTPQHNILNFSQLELEAIILHEIQHIRKPIVQTDKIQGKHFNNQERRWFKKYYQFEEKECDIKAALVNPGYAQALKNVFIKAQFFNIPSGEGTGHPIHIDRILYLDQLYQEMMAAIPQEQRAAYA